jgi:hypothetical protein
MDPFTLTFGIVGIAITAYYGVGYVTSKAKGTEATISTETISGTADTPTETNGTAGTTNTETGSNQCVGAVQANLETSETFQTWYGNTNSFFQTQALVVNPTRDEVMALIERAAEIEPHKLCLEKKISEIKASPTNLSNAQATESTLTKTIEQRRKDVQIAKDRAALAINPELTRSYYDGWFPLDRPMRPISIPILIAFSLFFFSLGLFITMGLLGVNIMMFRRQIPFVASQQPGLGFPFWGMTAVAVTLLALTLYAFLKK